MPICVLVFSGGIEQVAVRMMSAGVPTAINGSAKHYLRSNCNNISAYLKVQPNIVTVSGRSDSGSDCISESNISSLAAWHGMR